MIDEADDLLVVVEAAEAVPVAVAVLVNDRELVNVPGRFVGRVAAEMDDATG